MLKLAKAATSECSSTVTMIGSPHCKGHRLHGPAEEHLDLPAARENLGEVALVLRVEADRGLVGLHLADGGPGLEPVPLLEQPLAYRATGPIPR